MAKIYRANKKTRIIPILAAVVFVLLILSAGTILYRYFGADKTNNQNTNSYLIQNKYYGFGLKTPKNWFAEGKALYSEDNIAQFLSECKNDKSNNNSAYEIGRFRFEDQKYPHGFGDTGYFPAGFPSGAILDITVNCVPASINKFINYSSSNLKIGGEKAFEEILSLLGFGETKYLSFIHNGLQYKVNEYVYISPADKGSSEEKLKQNSALMFNEIISSFKFVK